MRSSRVRLGSIRWRTRHRRPFTRRRSNCARNTGSSKCFRLNRLKNDDFRHDPAARPACSHRSPRSRVDWEPNINHRKRAQVAADRLAMEVACPLRWNSQPGRNSIKEPSFHAPSRRLPSTRLSRVSTHRPAQIRRRHPAGHLLLVNYSASMGPMEAFEALVLVGVVVAVRRHRPQFQPRHLARLAHHPVQVTHLRLVYHPLVDIRP